MPGSVQYPYSLWKRDSQGNIVPRNSGDTVSGDFDISLSGLTDVEFSGITDNQILVYSGGTWYNQDNSSSSSTISLTGLTDVNVNNTLYGQIIAYSGGTWENNTGKVVVNDLDVNGTIIGRNEIITLGNITGGTWNVGANEYQVLNGTIPPGMTLDTDYYTYLTGGVTDQEGESYWYMNGSYLSVWFYDTIPDDTYTTATAASVTSGVYITDNVRGTEVEWSPQFTTWNMTMSDTTHFAISYSEGAIWAYYAFNHNGTVALRNGSGDDFYVRISGKNQNSSGDTIYTIEDSAPDTTYTKVSEGAKGENLVISTVLGFKQDSDNNPDKSAKAGSMYWSNLTGQVMYKDSSGVIHYRDGKIGADTYEGIEKSDYALEHTGVYTYVLNSSTFLITGLHEELSLCNAMEFTSGDSAFIDSVTFPSGNTLVTFDSYLPDTSLTQAYGIFDISIADMKTSLLFENQWLDDYLPRENTFFAANSLSKGNLQFYGADSNRRVYNLDATHINAIDVTVIVSGTTPTQSEFETAFNPNSDAVSFKTTCLTSGGTDKRLYVWYDGANYYYNELSVSGVTSSTSGTSGIDGTSGTSGIDGVGGSGTTYLSGLTDVEFSGLTDSQILVYSGGTWYNQDNVGGVTGGTSGTSGSSGIDGTSGTSGIDGVGGSGSTVASGTTEGQMLYWDTVGNDWNVINESGMTWNSGSSILNVDNIGINSGGIIYSNGNNILRDVYNASGNSLFVGNSTGGGTGFVRNTLVGNESYSNLGYGDFNTIIGDRAGWTASANQSRMTIVGQGGGINGGSYGTFIGTSTGGGSYSVKIGYSAGYDATADNELYIANGQDNGSYENTWIYGDANYNVTIPNGYLGLAPITGSTGSTYNELYVEVTDNLLKWKDYTGITHGINLYETPTSGNTTDVSIVGSVPTKSEFNTAFGNPTDAFETSCITSSGATKKLFVWFDTEDYHFTELTTA